MAGYILPVGNAASRERVVGYPTREGWLAFSVIELRAGKLNVPFPMPDLVCKVAHPLPASPRS